MWRLWNKLFGWHYIFVAAHNGLFVGKVSFVQNVPHIRSRNGVTFYLQDDKILKSLDSRYEDMKYTPLTFEPKKMDWDYFKKSE